MTQRGQMTLVTGPMFAKKSLMMLGEIQKVQKEGKYYLCLSTTKPEIRSRAMDYAVPAAHINPQVPNEMKELLEICKKEHGEYPEIIFIDEVQFLHPSAIEVLDWILNQDIDIMAAGLVRDFRDVTFPVIDDIFKYRVLTYHLEHMEKCHVCKEKDASHNQRLLYGQPNNEGPLIALDGEMYTYEARCDDCYQS